MSTLIQRQDATIARLVEFCESNVRKGFALGLSSIWRAHRGALIKAGYSNEEAVRSAEDCRDMARLQMMADGKEVPLGL